ncbi:MAG TPA: hypothetical protein VJM50_19855 [Pyrinomonadaceae bacterium]|nr:hypothetical protein [Pyrinomonadaceae bacterium]
MATSIRPPFVFCSAALIACLLCGPSLVRAQQTKDKWQRVYTGAESVIEINTSTLKFAPDYILRVQFRTIFSHAETLPGTSDTKYKMRLETIDFKLNEGRYRISETSLLDSSGKELQWYTTNQMREWRVLKSGGVTEKLFIAARSLPPFGVWKVVAYRLADGGPESRELEKLIGVRVNLQTNRAEVGEEICSLPAFEDKRASNEELFRELTVALKSIGVQESAEMITISCKGSGWQPPQSLLVKVREGEMLMLWEGVFLVLKR